MNLLVNYAGKNHKFHNTKMRVGNAETVSQILRVRSELRIAFASPFNSFNFNKIGAHERTIRPQMPNRKGVR